MNPDEVRGMFAPRKQLSRTNSSSSISSTSSNTTVATNGSQSNGTPLSAASDLSQWSGNAGPRKRPQPKHPWPVSKGEPRPAAQILIYPAVDVASETPSMTTYADAYPLTRATMDWFMGHYMSADADPADPRLSPDRTADLTGLAPAVVATAGFDPLVDQGEGYAKRLQAAGVPVLYRCYDSLAHGFTAFTGAIPAADGACREIAGLVRQAFDQRASQ